MNHPYHGLRRALFEIYFLTMPLHAWLIRGRQVRRIFLELQGSQFLSESALHELQLQRLKAIVKHHYETSDFFRRRLDDLGVNPDQIETLADLSKLPLLSKNDIRENLHAGLLSSAVPEARKIRISTSGSTGTPLVIYANREQLEARFAATLRSLEWTGWRFGDKQIRLWHQSLGMSRLQSLRERIDAFLLRRKFIPAFEISDRNIENCVSKIVRHQPVLIDGYAESLNFLASYVSTKHKQGIRPRAVMSSAQALPAGTRKEIETGFQTRVFDKYGSREFSGIAYECESHKGHHVVEECYIVELLTDGRPTRVGEIGEVVITDLLNQATPMIRYRIGDLAQAMSQSPPCGCGRKHFRIGEIAGRSQAIVHCANGVWLPGTFFAHFFKEYDSIIKFFQIEQIQKGSFRLKIVEGPNYSDESVAKIISDLRRYVGDTEVQVARVTEIPLLETGKRSPVVSSVTEDFQKIN